MVALCVVTIGYVLAWTATDPLGLPLITVSQSLLTTLGWLLFLIVIPVYVLYRVRIDWSFTGTLVPGKRGLVALAVSSIIWVGTEAVGVRSYGIDIVVLASLVVGILKIAWTMRAIDEAMIRNATFDLFDR